MALDSFLELEGALRPGFERAAAAHQEWRDAFERAIRRGDRDFRVEAANACEFGRWVEEDGRVALASPGALRMLHDLHCEFHDAAERAFARLRAGKIREAVALIQADSQYAKWSAMLSAALKGYGVTDPARSDLLD